MVIDALIRWVHLLAAVTWVGGMIFLLFVAFPALTHRKEQQRMSVITHTFARFLKLIWVSVGLLILSGIWNLYGRLHSPAIASLSVYYFGAFLIKFLLFLGMLSMAGKLHFAIIPRLQEVVQRETTHEPTAEFLQWQKKALGLMRGNLLIGIIIVLLAAYLASLATGG
jgi:putative copper export protein